MKYRKKPVVIEAFRWLGTEACVAEMATWAAKADLEGRKARGEKLIGSRTLSTPLDVIVRPGRLNLEVRTLNGVMKVDVGEWVICGVNGEFYPCKPDIFEATYEPAGLASVP